MIRTRTILATGLALLLGVLVPRVVNAAQAPVANAKAEKVDLNTATAEQLQELPGIGPANANKIIEHRPYKSLSDLSKAGLPANTVNKLSGKVTVKRQASRAPTATTTTTPKPKAESGTAAQKPKTQKTESAESAASSGKVWLNTDSNIYHREGSRWYGTTKSGKFVTEREAKAAGARAAEGEK